MKPAADRENEEAHVGLKVERPFGIKACLLGWGTPTGRMPP